MCVAYEIFSDSSATATLLTWPQRKHPTTMSPLKLIVACLAAASAAKKGPKVTNKVLALLALRRRSMHSHATGASLTGLL